MERGARLDEGWLGWGRQPRRIRAACLQSGEGRRRTSRMSWGSLPLRLLSGRRMAVIAPCWSHTIPIHESKHGSELMLMSHCFFQFSPSMNWY